MRSQLENNRILDPLFERGVQLVKMTWVPADNAVFDINFPPYVELNPAGAVDVLLPAGAAGNAGKMWLLSNISASTVTFKTVADNAFTTAIVLATLENTILFCTGSTTEAIAWRALATALST